MAEFPRTQVESLSLPRMIIGTNWFLGFSHTSKAKDDLINSTMTSQRIADVLEVFLRAGIDALLGIRPDKRIEDAIKDAQDRVGRKMINIGLPTLNIQDGQAAMDESARLLDDYARIGTDICMPHQATTDALVNKRTRTIPGMDVYCHMIRERKMIPGLSTHMPETPMYADETSLDVASYIQIYNAIGFLMQIEVDWVHRMIWQSKKPVITIKPMAAGRLMPLVGLAFAWATLRDCDMVTVGTMSPDEARELIDISLSLLERRSSTVPLQRTRSKESVEPRKK